jgi:hypothetical protein
MPLLECFLQWACSSVGRAPRSQRGGQGFEPPHVHHIFNHLGRLRHHDQLPKLPSRVGQLEAGSVFFCPLQSEFTLTAQFRVARGDVAWCVPGPKVPQCFRTPGLLKVGNAKAAENVESALRVIERY